MSLLRRLFGIETKATLASPDAELLALFASTTPASGISITPRSAMSCAPVRCAVQAISEAVGQLPVLVYQRLEGGGKERAPEHPSYGLLHDQANEWTSASDFREQLTRDCLLEGNAYGFINRLEAKPVELIRLAPENMSVAFDTLTTEPSYIFTDPDSGAKRTFDRQDILHIRAPSLDGVSGVSPIQSCREAIGVALVLEQHAARLFGNSARPSGVFSFKEKMTEKAVANARAAWIAAFAGDKSGGTAFLEGGADWKAITLNSVDAQFLELRQFQILEIARAFRVPPTWLMELGRATWGNAGELRRHFLDFCLTPWLKRFESEFRLKLISAEDRNTYFAEFLVDDLLRTDIEKRAAAYQTMIAARVLNPNEARAMENRAPYPEGDKFENPNTTAGGAANAAA